MFLSTFTDREDNEAGNYFSYPQATTRLQKNLQVCLPRGFTSSGPEYQMYKDNCIDLMADHCAVEWDPLCNAYQSNLHKNEQDLFKQYVDERSTAHPLAATNSCTKQTSAIVPEQVEIRGINPYVDQKTGIAFPLSCPSKVNDSIKTSEFVGQQVYLHEQQRNRSFPPPFAYSSSQQNRQTKTTPIPFAPRPNGSLNGPDQTEPVDQSSSVTPIPFAPRPTDDQQKVEVQLSSPISVTMLSNTDEKESVTPIPFMPGQEKPAASFMPEQLNNGTQQKKVAFNLPSSPVSMFVTDEAAINELIYGSEADCSTKTACSISKIMN